MTRGVPPDGKKGSPLLIIGESPGTTEVEHGKPFVGPSGDKLFESLNRYGITRDNVYMMNLSEYQPAGNRFENCPQQWIEDGRKKIIDYITLYRPNCILSLGEHPLRFLTDRGSITHHRGSILPCNFDGESKVCAAYHPSFILRNPELSFLFDFDVRRATEQSQSRAFPYLSRHFRICDDSNAEIAFRELSKAKRISVDLETTKKDKKIICIGFALSPTETYSIAWSPFVHILAQQLLEDPEIEKVFHYGFGFDIPFLEHFYGIQVKGKIHDTYILSHAIDPTLPRGLDFLTSVHTYEPYYKTMGRAALPGDSKAWGEKANKSDVYIYNAKDCGVTLEIFENILKFIEEPDLDTYEFEIEDAVLAYKVGKNGLPFSTKNQKILQDAVLLKWQKLQVLLNSMAMKPINVNSSKDVPELLYKTLGLPEKKKGDKVTTDDTALVWLLGYTQARIDSVIKQETKAKWIIQRNIIKLVRDIRGLRKLRSSYTNIEISLDGRLRSLYNAAGTATGRWSAGKYIDDTGLNPQTFPRLDFKIPEKGEDLDAFKQSIARQLDDEADASN